MALSNEQAKERMKVICKTYIAINRKATAREVFDFIQKNNFGISNIGYYQVVDYLRNNTYKRHKSGRGCLNNCYGYTKEGNKARVYHLKER